MLLGINQVLLCNHLILINFLLLWQALGMFNKKYVHFPLLFLITLMYLNSCKAANGLVWNIVANHVESSVKRYWQYLVDNFLSENTKNHEEGNLPWNKHEIMTWYKIKRIEIYQCVKSIPLCHHAWWSINYTGFGSHCIYLKLCNH